MEVEEMRTKIHDNITRISTLEGKVDVLIAVNLLAIVISLMK